MRVLSVVVGERAFGLSRMIYYCTAAERRLRWGLKRASRAVPVCERARSRADLQHIVCDVHSRTLLRELTRSTRVFTHWPRTRARLIYYNIESIMYVYTQTQHTHMQTQVYLICNV